MTVSCRPHFLTAVWSPVRCSRPQCLQYHIPDSLGDFTHASGPTLEKRWSGITKSRIWHGQGTFGPRLDYQRLVLSSRKCAPATLLIFFTQTISRLTMVDLNDRALLSQISFPMALSLLSLERIPSKLHWPPFFITFFSIHPAINGCKTR